jgi:23S rRNA (uracil1939-C5)-methyltransferase
MPEMIELELTSMAHGGSAVGRHEGRAIFVPYAIPGERITAAITQDKGRFATALPVEILEQSRSRVIPRCKHFGKCGGCHWQHIDYPEQLRFKQQIVADQMRRLGGLPDAVVHPTIPSPDPWAYRSHVTFHITPDGQPGYISTDDRTVLPIEACHIIRPELVEMFEALKAQRAERAQRLRIQVGSLSNERTRIASNSRDNEIDSPTHLDAFAAGSSIPPDSAVHYTIRGQTFRCTAGSFFQVNLPQAEVLVDLVLKHLDLRGTERALDLYAGVGLFTAFLAAGAKQVTMIESAGSSVEDAKVNLAAFPNVRMVEGLVENALPRLQSRFDVAVVDPPRSGMKPKALDALMKTQPRKIVYVSCDPATLARDVKALVVQGYQLIEVQPVDMFPQTYHIECVAALER